MRIRIRVEQKTRVRVIPRVTTKVSVRVRGQGFSCALKD